MDRPHLGGDRLVDCPRMEPLFVKVFPVSSRFFFLFLSVSFKYNFKSSALIALALLFATVAIIVVYNNESHI